ncbi:hypothetical protein SAMN05216389_1112 [Oceanobacillus limi]|uniref:Uncharacterized protein n=1 Tax=Oceanobacillus limi TaxID=930131 RepID=A0A1I0EB46_9BACI|nr:hypothetical protein [Oceanobacillus limi]SET41966.1 hypothetical protein SAMN05216389_1112 [Oceanobacillus limi]
MNEIIRRHSEGLPVNYSAIRVQDDALRRRCTALFGGYSKAVEACGFNYDDFRTDTAMASYYGIILEDLVKDIFAELRIEFGEKPPGNLRPDIIMRYKRWVDVKLSEWTIDNRDCPTVEKYLPHCRSLTIVYLRGRQGGRMYDDKVRLINVKEYVKQLPKHIRSYYYSKLDEIETMLNEINV